MTPTNTQGASSLETGVLTTTGRQERPDSRAAETTIFGVQFSAIFDKAGGGKARESAQGGAPDDKTAETQSSNLVGPGLVLEGLVLLHLAGTQAASSNGQPAATEQPAGMEQPGAPQTSAFGVATPLKSEAPNASLAVTSNNAEQPKSMTLDAFVKNFPGLLAQAVSENVGVSKAPGVETSNNADSPKSMAPDAFAKNFPAVLTQAVSGSVGVSKAPYAEAPSIGDAPKRLTVSSFATHLPPVQAAVPPTEAAFADAGSNNQAGQPQLGAAAENPTEKGGSTVDETFPPQLNAVVDSPTLPVGGSSSVAGGFSPESVRTAASSAPRAPTNDQVKDSPSKVLTIQLEPEDLGAVTVRMQLTKTRVSLKIDVDSPAVQTMLSQSRDQLAEALSRAGHTVDEIAIKVSPTPVPSGSFGDTRQNDSQAHHNQSGEGGAPSWNDGTGSNREERSFSRASKKGESQGDEPVPLGRARSTGAPGLYL